MPETSQGAHLNQLSGVYSEANNELYEALAASLNPLGPLSLTELAGGLLTPQSRILDAGCRDARQLLLLTSKYGCHGVGIDPLREHVQQALALVAKRAVTGRVQIEQAIIERLPHRSGSFDFIWCRDVLTLIDDLDRAFTEFARVLSPQGHILVYINFATHLLEPLEAERINRPLGNVASSMERDKVETAIRGARLSISQVREIGTEWREYEEERTKPVSDDLLKLARLRRNRDDTISRFGQGAYDIAEASLHWLSYQLLGKLKPVIYVLRHAQTRE